MLLLSSCIIFTSSNQRWEDLKCSKTDEHLHTVQMRETYTFYFISLVTFIWQPMYPNKDEEEKEEKNCDPNQMGNWPFWTIHTLNFNLILLQFSSSWLQLLQIGSLEPCMAAASIIVWACVGMGGWMQHCEALSVLLKYK